MFCNKCGKEIEKGTKFCPGCGEKVVEKKEEKVAEPKKVVASEPATESNGLGIAGMVMGIISVLLCWSIAFIIVPVVGLILSCVAKGKKGFKIAGIILNAVAIVLMIVFVIIVINLGVKSIFRIADEVSNDPNIQEKIDTVKDSVKDGYDKTKKTLKSESPYGTWTCVPYSSSNLQQYDYDNIKSNSKDDQTVLKLNYDNSFQYGPYVDSYKNYYKGTFTYEIEKDKNEQNASKGYKFIMVKGPVSSFMIDGVNQDTTGKELYVEMELFEQYDYDKALIMFVNNYNMYFCER